MPIELGFILQRLAAMAEQDSTLRDEQPWNAAHEKDFAWLGDVVTRHYQGDDSLVKILIGGIARAFAGMTVDAYGGAAHTSTGTPCLPLSNHDGESRRGRAVGMSHTGRRCIVLEPAGG